MNDITDQQRDQADMERLAAGDDSALNDLMARHSQKLFNYLIRSLQNEEDAADLAQETFVRVYQNRTKFNSDQKFSTWIYAIATNLVKDRFRYRSRHPQVSMDAQNEATGSALGDMLMSESPVPGERLQIEERAETVRKAVALLPEELRTPLILYEYEDLAYGAIAQILRCSTKAVETRIYRARQQLRGSLGKLLKD